MDAKNYFQSILRFFYTLSYFIDPSEDPLHSHSLFGSKNEIWKEKRAEITPAFTNVRLKNLHQRVQGDIRKFVEDNIRNQNKALEAKELSAKLFCEVTSSSIYGLPTSEKIHHLADRMTLKVTILTRVKMLLILAFPSLKKHFKINFLKAEDHLSFLQIIKSDNSDDNFLGSLKHLKNVKKEISTVDLASHSISFLSHGIEMSSIALSHTLYEVCFNLRYAKI